jgi:hypothetical protein
MRVQLCVRDVCVCFCGARMAIERCDAHAALRFVPRPVVVKQDVLMGVIACEWAFWAIIGFHVRVFGLAD